MFIFCAEIAIAWIENVEGLATVKEGQEVDRAIENVDVVVIAYLTRILKRFKETNGHATGEIVIVIVIVIEIVREDVPGVTNAIAIGTVRGTSVIVIVNVEIEKIGVIVRMKIRKKSESKRNLWMVYFS